MLWIYNDLSIDKFVFVKYFRKKSVYSILSFVIYHLQSI